MNDVIASLGSGPVIIAAVLIFLAIFLLTKPIRLIFKLLLNTALGFVALMLINHFGAAIGISLGVNWLNAVIAGVLGVPGVALLFVLKWLMLI